MADQINSFPMISEKNWWTIRDKFKASLPQTVTTKYIKTLLSMANENSANSNVIVPLKRIGFIDGDNKPTSLAIDWRIDDKYKSVCETILKNVYPAELLDLFPDSDIDRSSARSWFMSSGVGQAAADKMVAFFVLLKSGEIKNKKAKVVDKNSSPKAKNPKQTKKNNSAEIKVTPSENPADSLDGMKSTNRPDLHIDLQIHISPDSTPEQIDSIFASMAKHLYGMYNK